MRNCLSWRSLICLVPVVVALTGCRGVWTDMQENFSDMIHRPDPMKVAQNNKSGDRRAKFLASIPEPARHGGSQKEQDEAVHLLVKTATTDPYPICRLCAIKRLGEFEDPRAVNALQDAYYEAKTFPPHINNLVRQRALESIGQVGHRSKSPQAKQLARDHLLKVARAAAKEKDSVEKQLTLDERMAAIRALSHFKDREVAETLVRMLHTERDVAVRKRTHKTLQLVTGESISANDPNAWERALHIEAAPGTPGHGNQIQPVRHTGSRH